MANISLSEDEQKTLDSLNELLDMVDTEDWNLFHRAFARKVASGEYSKDLEQSYKQLVDKKLAEREAGEIK